MKVTIRTKVIKKEMIKINYWYVLHGTMEKFYFNIIILQKKCKHFKDPIVEEAFEIVCVDEMISQKSIPDYMRIINALSEAINQINEDYVPLKFEWVNGPEHWITKLILDTAKTEYQKWKDQKH